MNEESSSKQTYKITWICQFPVQSTSQVGEVREILRKTSRDLQASLRSMLPDSVASPAIRMEVEEVSPSRKSSTKRRSSTKTPSTPKTTSATLPEKVERAGLDPLNNRPSQYYECPCDLCEYRRRLY